MWQSNRTSGKTSKKKIKISPQLEMRRVTAEIKSGGSLGHPAVIAKARVILSDFSPESVALFTTHSFQQGAEISLTIDLPQQFFCRGKIQWCAEAATSGNVMSEGQSFRYRVNIAFLYDSDEERKQIVEYCIDLAKQKMLILKRPAA